MYVKKVTAPILFIFLFSTCSDEVTPSAPTPDSTLEVTGVVHMDSASRALNTFIVQLKEHNYIDRTVSDTVNADDSFLFYINAAGECSISLNVMTYVPIDTTLFISSNTTLVFHLEYLNNELSEEQKNQLNYLPLQVGNKWIYRKISTHYYNNWENKTVDTSITQLELTDENNAFYTTQQNTFTTSKDKGYGSEFEIIKNDKNGQLGIGYRRFYLFGEVGEEIKIDVPFGVLRILSEKTVIWNNTETIEKQFKISHEWTGETINFLQGIGISQITWQDDYNKADYYLVAWNLNGKEYGDTTLFN